MKFIKFILIALILCKFQSTIAQSVITHGIDRCLLGTALVSYDRSTFDCHLIALSNFEPSFRINPAINIGGTTPLLQRFYIDNFNNELHIPEKDRKSEYYPDDSIKIVGKKYLYWSSYSYYIQKRTLYFLFNTDIGYRFESKVMFLNPAVGFRIGFNFRIGLTQNYMLVQTILLFKKNNMSNINRFKYYVYICF